MCSQERLFIHKTGSHAAAKNAIKAGKYITISMKGYNFAALTFSYLWKMKEYINDRGF